MELPLFCRVPDFYIPNLNIQRVRAEHETVLQSMQQIEILSNLVGVSSQQIHTYILELEEKEFSREKKKQIEKSFKSRYISQMTIPLYSHS